MPGQQLHIPPYDAHLRRNPELPLSYYLGGRAAELTGGCWGEEDRQAALLGRTLHLRHHQLKGAEPPQRAN